MRIATTILALSLVTATMAPAGAATGREQLIRTLTPLVVAMQLPTDRLGTLSPADLAQIKFVTETNRLSAADARARVAHILERAAGKPSFLRDVVSGD